MPNIRILAQEFLKIPCRQSFTIAIMVKSKKEHTLVNISRNLLKSYSGHLNIDPNLYANYQNPSSSGSQDIVLTRFFYCYTGRVEKGA